VKVGEKEKFVAGTGEEDERETQREREGERKNSLKIDSSLYSGLSYMKVTVAKFRKTFILACLLEEKNC
jgi:hypothetical protein